MWYRIKLILSNKQLMLRILFTVLMLLLFRALMFVKIPLLNDNAFNWIASTRFLEVLNNFGGQALQNSSIIALGISPYITSSIVVQLLQMVIPPLKEWSEQGETGKQKSSKLTRYLAIVLAFLQGLLLIIGAGGLEAVDPGISNPNYFHVIFMTLVVTAGSALTIWMADLITKRGIGNGTSILIVAGIVTSIPSMFTSTWSQFIVSETNKALGVFKFSMIWLLYLLMILGVTFFQIASRKIPIQYANRQGKSDSNIPLKLNSSGVMPVIFASTLLSIPLTIVGSLTGGGLNTASGWGFWFDQVFSSSKIIGFMLYAILIIIFSFFYSFMTINPDKISDNLSKSNAYIPGYRPGEETKTYISKLLFKITVIGTIYLVIVAAMPILITVLFGITSASVSIGGTSLLIIVGVAIETTQQIETDANKSEYTGIF